MSIEQDINRIAAALEQLAGIRMASAVGTEKAPEAKKVRRVKETGMPAQQAAEVVPVPAVDTIPGMDDAPAAVVVTEVLAPESTVRTGAELRNLAQQFIAAADKSDPGGKNSTVNKLVTFIQSVAKIFNAAEPKLIKIPEAKVPEAAAMIADWCGKNGIRG
jgi:hypothetical protein